MSKEKLPEIPAYKHALGNYEIAMHMGHHRRKVEEMARKKQRSHSTVSYRDLLDGNPKKQYMLETKYTEIERENRLLFEKIAENARKKSPQAWSSQKKIGSLNVTFRKQQIEEIERQNAQMYCRLLKQKPSISFLKADQDYRKTRKLSNQLSSIEKHRLYDWY